MAISARDRITRLTVYANESDMIDDTNGTEYTDGVVDGTQRFEHIKFNSLPGFGEANAAMYKCEISGTTDLTGKWIRVRYCFYDTDSATTRTVEAVFAGKVDSCKYDRYHISRSLVAYDKIYDLRNIDISDWWSNYWSTANDSTAFEVFDAMCTSFGVFHMLTSSDFRNNFTILKDAQKGRKLGGCSFADFLRYVGQINGFYWEVLPSGMLTCTAPTASYPQSFDTYTDFKETTIEDADSEAYGTFTVYDGADIIYTSGTGEPTYTFSNNILLYGHTTASLVSILDVTKNYLVWFVGTRPATVEVIYSQIPERQAISVTDNGTARTCVISKNEMWGAQLINQRLTCTGNRVIGVQYSSAMNRVANDIQQIGVELTYKVNAAHVIEAVNLEAQGGVQINAEAININGAISANGNTKINTDGTLEAVNGKFSGQLTSQTGTIGGFNLANNKIYKRSGATPAEAQYHNGVEIISDYEPAIAIGGRTGGLTPQGETEVVQILQNRFGISVERGFDNGGDAGGAFVSENMTQITGAYISMDDGDNETFIDPTSFTIGNKDILRTHQSLVGGWFLRGTITANSDLNTGALCKVGRWSCSTAVANTLRNTPVYTEFVMTVRAATQTGDLGDESGTWTYRIREIETWNGIKYRQQCSTQGTAGVWTFGAWYLDGSSAINGTLTANTGSFSESHCRQSGRVVDIHAWLANLSTSTQSHSNAIKVTGVSLPSVPVRFVCTCWLNNGIAAYAGYGVLDTYGNISLVKGVANSNKVSFAISYVV